MLYVGARQIIKEIAGSNKNVRQSLAKEFANKISKDKSLKIPFLLAQEVAKYENKLTLSEANRFVNYLYKKYGEQIKEVSYSQQSVNSLFESYQVDKSNLEFSKFDEIINYDKKVLNESVIISIVADINKKKRIEAELDNKIEERILENKEYKAPKRTIGGLKRQLGLLESRLVGLTEFDQRNIKASIETILEQGQKNLREGYEKAFKLKSYVDVLNLTHKATIDQLKEANFDGAEKMLNKSVTGETISLGEIGIFTDVRMEDVAEEDGPCTLTFCFDVYPNELYYFDRTEELFNLSNDLIKTKFNLFKAIIKAGVEPNLCFEGCKIDVNCRKQLTDDDFEKLNKCVKAKIEVVIFNSENVLTQDELKAKMYDISRFYSDCLLEKFGNVLSAEAQSEALEEAAKKDKPKHKFRQGAFGAKVSTNKLGYDDKDLWTEAFVGDNVKTIEDFMKIYG